MSRPRAKRRDPADEAPAPVVVRGYLAGVALRPGKDGAPPGCVLRLEVGAAGAALADLAAMVGPRLAITLEAEQLTLVLDVGGAGEPPPAEPAGEG